MDGRERPPRLQRVTFFNRDLFGKKRHQLNSYFVVSSKGKKTGIISQLPDIPANA
jgi:hypothetical protein